jgi:hypothetical protein
MLLSWKLSVKEVNYLILYVTENEIFPTNGKCHNVGFEILTVVMMKIMVFQCVMSSSCLAYSLILKTKVTCSSGKSAFLQTTWHYNPENCMLQGRIFLKHVKKLKMLLYMFSHKVVKIGWIMIKLFFCLMTLQPNFGQ